MWFFALLLSWMARPADGSPDPGAPEVAAPSRPSAAERGRRALLGRSDLSPTWSLGAYRAVAEFWDEPAPDPDRRPEEFAARFNRRYGLHPAPYPNDGLPMGLRVAESDEGRRGLQVDCMLCHGGSIGGRSIVGLGNTQLDMTGLYKDLFRAEDVPFLSPFTINTVRGNVNAGQMAVVLISLRDGPELRRRLFPVAHGARFPETDVPPWWNLKHKESMYYDGRTDARSVRSIMQFFMGEFDVEDFEALEPTFADVLAYLRSIEPPAYPFPIDEQLAGRGRALFEQSCARCHGTYGDERSYPNRIVPLHEIGTDPARLEAGTDRIVAHYNSTWFAERYPIDSERVGYQAPPLDGIWASAPYLHNGAVPTVAQLLDSSSRPDRYRRPPSTDLEHYDPDRLGWRVEVLDPASPEEARRDRDRTIFDASRFGLGNQGHLFGDPLSDEQRRAIIEYLKTL